MFLDLKGEKFEDNLIKAQMAIARSTSLYESEINEILDVLQEGELQNAKKLSQLLRTNITDVKELNKKNPDEFLAIHLEYILARPYNLEELVQKIPELFTKLSETYTALLRKKTAPQVKPETVAVHRNLLRKVRYAFKEEEWQMGIETIARVNSSIYKPKAILSKQIEGKTVRKTYRFIQNNFKTFDELKTYENIILF